MADMSGSCDLGPLRSGVRMRRKVQLKFRAVGYNELNRRFKASDNECASLKRQLEEKNEELKELSEASTAKRLSLEHDLMGIICRVESVADELECQLKASNDQRKLMEHELAELRSRLECQVKASNDPRLAMEHELAEIRSRLECQVKTSNDQRHSLEHELDALRSRLDSTSLPSQGAEIVANPDDVAVTIPAGDQPPPPPTDIRDEIIRSVVYGGIDESKMSLLDHWILATASLCAIGGLWWSARKLDIHPAIRSLIGSTMGMAVVQVTLEITTLLSYVPVSLGTAHQAGALTLLSLMILLNHNLRRPSSQLLKALPSVVKTT